MIIEKIRSELKKHDKPENKINAQRFFKEKLDDPFFLKTVIFKKISDTCYKDIKNQPPKEILAICNQLVELNERYPRGFAFHWAHKLKGRYAKSNFRMFESWLKNHVQNWGACDSLCCGALGHIVLQYPELSQKTIKWTKSKNRWVRRGSAVSLIIPVRKKLLLKEVFQTADILLTDDDDMVQKGYGWMLKVASNQFPDRVFKYVMKNKREMPRTALRYAIEKLPPAKRKQAMLKDW